VSDSRHTAETVLRSRDETGNQTLAQSGAEAHTLAYDAGNRVTHVAERPGWG
jgi:hypothetical protein